MHEKCSKLFSIIDLVAWHHVCEACTSYTSHGSIRLRRVRKNSYLNPSFIMGNTLHFYNGITVAGWCRVIGYSSILRQRPPLDRWYIVKCCATFQLNIHLLFVCVPLPWYLARNIHIACNVCILHAHMLCERPNSAWKVFQAFLVVVLFVWHYFCEARIILEVPNPHTICTMQAFIYHGDRGSLLQRDWCRCVDYASILRKRPLDRGYC